MIRSLSEEFDGVTWPANVLTTGEVRSWITAAYPDKPTVHGPLMVYAAKDNFGVTARFEVLHSGGKREDAVFKANIYTGFSGAAHAFDLLSRHCPDNAPYVIKWENTLDHSYILFRHFTGKRVREVGSIATLQQMAQTFARIQVTVASLPMSETAALPRFRVAELPALFDEFRTNIQTRYRSVWDTDQGRLTSILGFPASEVPDRLEALRSDVVAWSIELDSAEWPDSICHGDLHGDNAIIQENGTILIYDWEDAVISCPFLSIERMMVEAWCDDTRSTSAPWGYIAGTPGQNVVRDTYIDAIPWKSRAERVRACMVAECLAVIKEACLEQRWAESMGMQDANPEWTAQLISRLYQHRNALSR